jgi:hypothetical protein
MARVNDRVAIDARAAAWGEPPWVRVAIDARAGAWGEPA